MNTINHGSIAFKHVATLFPARHLEERLVQLTFVPVGKKQEYVLLLNAQQIENLKKALKDEKEDR